MKTVLFTILILFNTFCTVKAQKEDELLKPERVYLHTDRNIYIAGEYLFYTLYLKGNPGQLSKFAYLVLRDHNNSSVSNIRLEINNQMAFGSVYLPDTLSSGIYQIVCYTNFMRNEAEEVYFNKEIVIVNRFDEKMDLFTHQINNAGMDPSAGQYSGTVNSDGNLIIQLDKQIFTPGEKISFSIEINKIQVSSITYLSVSVGEIIPGMPVQPDISDYFSINNNRVYGDRLINNFCIYKPEIKGTVLQGRVFPLSQFSNQGDSLNKNFKNGVKSHTVLVSTVDSIVNMQFTTTDSLGSFGFLLNRYYDGKELFIRLKDDDKATIVPDNKFSLAQPFSPSGAFNVPGMKDFLIRSGKIAQVKRYYNERVAIDTNKEFLPVKTIPRLYYRPNATIHPSDYLELQDFVEISREIVPALKLRKSHDRFISDYLNLQDPAQSHAEPAIFLDGVPIDDINQIINLGSNQINSIETLPVTRFYGDMSFAGILAVFSKNLVINNIHFKTPTLKLQALMSQPYTKPEPFKPTNNNKHIPDLRQLLLWEPDVILNNKETLQIECYASDLQGKYRINIQGINSEGNPVSGSAIISIQSNPK